MSFPPPSGGGAWYGPDAEVQPDSVASERANEEMRVRHDWALAHPGRIRRLLTRLRLRR